MKADNFKCFSEARINGTYTWENLTKVQHKWEISRVGAIYRDYCGAILYCTRKSQEGGLRNLYNQTMELARIYGISNMNRGTVTLTCHQHEVCHACSFHYMPFCNTRINSAREIIKVTLLLTCCQNSAILLRQKN